MGVGDVAKRTGIPVSMLRFHGETGLIVSVGRLPARPGREARP